MYFLAYFQAKNFSSSYHRNRKKVAEAFTFLFQQKCENTFCRMGQSSLYCGLSHFFIVWKISVRMQRAEKLSHYKSLASILMLYVPLQVHVVRTFTISKVLVIGHQIFSVNILAIIFRT